MQLKKKLTAVGNTVRRCSYIGAASEMGKRCKESLKHDKIRSIQLLPPVKVNPKKKITKFRVGIQHTNASLARNSAASTLYLSSNP